MCVEEPNGMGVTPKDGFIIEVKVRHMVPLNTRPNPLWTWCGQKVRQWTVIAEEWTQVTCRDCLRRETYRHMEDIVRRNPDNKVAAKVAAELKLITRSG